MNEITNKANNGKLKMTEQSCINEQDYYSRINTYTTICLFKCNFYSIRNYYIEGGAIFISISQKYTTINNFTDCLFYQCESKSGGAVYISTTSSCEAEFLNCTFQNNFVFQKVAYSAVTVKGGALLIEKTNSTFSFCKFINNTSYSSSSVSMSDSFGGCLYLYLANISINECAVTNNTACCDSHQFIGHGRGGFLYCNLSKINLFSSTFTNNSCICKTDKNSTIYSNGGCLYLYRSLDDKNIIRSCKFLHNLVFGFTLQNPTLYIYGGGIYTECNLTINSSIFNENRIQSEGIYVNAHGGAIYITNAYSYLILNSCQCSDNYIYTKASSYFNEGACIFCEYANGTFNDVNIINNSIHLFGKAYAYGGAIFLSGSSISGNIRTFNKCNFISNYIYLGLSSNHWAEGGCIYIESGNHFFNLCNFSNNNILTS